MILTATETAPAGWVTLNAKILEREFLGVIVRYGARLGATRALVDVPFRSGDAVRNPGDAVTVAISTHSFRWLES